MLGIDRILSFDLLRFFFGQQFQEHVALNGIGFGLGLVVVTHDVLALDECFHGFIHESSSCPGKEMAGSRGRWKNYALELLRGLRGKGQAQAHLPWHCDRSIKKFAPFCGRSSSDMSDFRHTDGTTALSLRRRKAKPYRNVRNKTLALRRLPTRRTLILKRCAMWLSYNECLLQMIATRYSITQRSSEW